MKNLILILSLLLLLPTLAEANADKKILCASVSAGVTTCDTPFGTKLTRGATNRMTVVLENPNSDDAGSCTGTPSFEIYYRNEEAWTLLTTLTYGGLESYSNYQAGTSYKAVSVGVNTACVALKLKIYSH